MMHRKQPAATASPSTSSRDGSIFRTARKLIEPGFVEIAPDIGLIAEGTLRPVRSFVPSFLALASIAAFTTATLVLVVTTVAHAGLRMSHDSEADAAWSRWSRSPELRFGDNTIPDADFASLAEAQSTPDSWPNTSEHEQLDTTHVALWSAKP